MNIKKPIQVPLTLEEIGLIRQFIETNPVKGAAGMRLMLGLDDKLAELVEDEES